MMLANKGLAFSLYEFHLEGIPAEELAASYALPLAWVEERIEAVRLYVEYERKLSAATSVAAAIEVVV